MSSEAVRRRMIKENPSSFYESPVTQVQNQSFNEKMFIKQNVNSNNIETIGDEANALITKDQ